MSAPVFSKISGSYAKLWAGMVVAPAHQAACDRAARAILAYKKQYVAAEQATTVPWFVIGMIDMMEAGGGCRRHLHNGDSLLHRTVNVPRGRLPAPAQPPFTWLQSAKDALAIDGLDKVKAWSVELLCYELEKYNGFGYRAHGINSPYLWSYSNEYHAGKFVSDGVYSPTAVSGQCGAMPIFKSLCTLDKTVSFDGKPASPAAPTPHTATEPHELNLGDLVHGVEELVSSFVKWAKAK
jgi:lysozyme family protein